MPTYSYDHSQATTDDRVKFHLGQVGTTSDIRDISDEEIAAVIARTPYSGRVKEFMAAVECLDSILVRHGIVGGGAESDQVSKYKVVYAGRSTKLDTLIQLRNNLLAKARSLSVPKPRSAHFVNVTGYST